MTLHEKTFSPGGGAGEGLWLSIECSELQVIEWPDHDRALGIEYADRRGEGFVMRNPEPGMRIVLQPRQDSPARIRVSTVQPAEEILSIARCRLRSIVYPEGLLEQPKQEVQGESLTKGTSVIVPTATETSLGDFTAWRSGILRTAGSLSVDPKQLRFRLYSTTGLTHPIADTGLFAHRPVTWEYSMRSGGDTFAVPTVHAGRRYRLTVEHSDPANISYDADVYIEPVALN